MNELIEEYLNHIYQLTVVDGKALAILDIVTDKLVPKFDLIEQLMPVFRLRMDEASYIISEWLQKNVKHVAFFNPKVYL